MPHRNPIIFLSIALVLHPSRRSNSLSVAKIGKGCNGQRWGSSFTVFLHFRVLFLILIKARLSETPYFQTGDEKVFLAWGVAHRGNLYP